MEKSSGKGDAKEEWRQVAGLNLSILDKEVSIEPGALCELLLFLAFLGG